MIAAAPTTTERMCAGCRQRRAREALLRFVADPSGRLVLDPLMRLPGRGVHTCPDPGCLQQAVRRGAFPRMLRSAVDVPPAGELARGAAGATARRSLELLGLLHRGRRLEIGAADVLERMHDLALVVVATDLSTRRAADVVRRAAGANVPVARFSTRSSLGRALGRKPTGVLGAMQGRLTSALAVEIIKANMLAPTDGVEADGVYR